jgi:hypothetical protein
MDFADIGQATRNVDGRRTVSLFKKWTYPAALLVLLFAVEIHTAYTRPFWFDELSILFISSTPTLHEMFRAIPTDGNPPLYFLLARGCLHLPIKIELALRLPAIFAFMGAALAIYRFVRRHAEARFAFLAMSMFTGSVVGNFAYEARAYTLMLFFTCLALCCWQRACAGLPRYLALAGLTGSIAGAILSHQYGVIYALMPVLTGEAVRAWRCRRVDLPMLVAPLLSLPLLLLTYPPTLRAQKPLLDAIKACPVFFAHPKLSDLTLYAVMVPQIILPLAISTALALLIIYSTVEKVRVVAPDDRLVHSHAPAEEFAAAGAAALLLPLMLLVTHFGTNYFMVRYGLGSAVGIALLTGMLFDRFRAQRLRIIVTTYACLLSFLMACGLRAVPLQLDPMLLADTSSEPIVVASALQFSPAWWYADPQMRERLHYLSDLTYANRYSDLLPEYSLALESAYTPMHMEDYEAFLASHSHFRLYCYGEPRIEWIKKRLTSEGWHLRLLQSIPNPKTPSYEEQTYREIYDVTR